MTYLDRAPLAEDTGWIRAGSGPAVPTAGALTAHRPLAAPGAALTAGLLHDWQRRNREASLPLALRQLDAAGNLGNMRAAADAPPSAAGARVAVLARAADSVHPATAAEGADVAEATDGPDGPGAGGPDGPDGPGGGRPAPRTYHGPVFMDSDLYKTLEAIGWALARVGPGPAAADDDELARFAAGTVALLERAQEADGYLDSYIQVSGEPRYGRLSSSHEMYCAGHLIQAAVAMRRTAADARTAANDGATAAAGHAEVAGRLLAVAGRLADHLVETFLGREAGLDGHPVIETALAELYRETGRRDYLALATQFVDQHGLGLAGDSGRGRRYLQDYFPVREAVTLEGHAVRALYLEAGIVDVATETGDEALLASSIARWEDMVATKTYLTGGNGSRHSDEAFGDRFELPPDRAYNETCAAIASFHWSWRLLLATGEARYADLMERVLYNAFGAAISTDGQRFFYVNPLQRREGHVEGDDPGRRHEWFSCACCPPNIMRLLASLQHYVATTAGEVLYLHQFTGSQITAPLADETLGIAVTTGYPWTGEVSVRVERAPAAECGLAFRVPSWSAVPHVTVNGGPVGAARDGGGYVVITRRWREGDVVAWTFGLSARQVVPDPRIDAVRGCAAIERGPLVYCFEQADQPAGTDLDGLALTGRPALRERPQTLPGVGPTVLIDADARAVSARPAQPSGLPYATRFPRAGGDRVTATAVPYFQWDNRDGRAMRVWLPRAGATETGAPETSAAETG